MAIAIKVVTSVKSDYVNPFAPLSLQELLHYYELIRHSLIDSVFALPSKAYCVPSDVCEEFPLFRKRA